MPREFVHPLVVSVIGGFVELEPPCPWTFGLSELPSQLHSDGMVLPPLVGDCLFLRPWLFFAPSQIFFCVVNEAQLLVFSHRRRQFVRTDSGLVTCQSARAS
jgi:hypothetical protein